MPPGWRPRAGLRRWKPCASAASSRSNAGVPFFSYKGRDGRGEPVHGVLEGADSGAIAGQLFGLGIIPLEIKPSAAPRSETSSLNFSFGKKKVTHTEVLLFSRQMYTLLKAGVPIM